MTRRPKGEGSLVQRADGRWEARVDLGRGPDGKRLRKAITGRTREECRARLVTLLAAHQRHELVLTPRVTFAAFLEDWLTTVIETTCEAQTAINYRSAIRARIVPVLGQHQLGKLTPALLQAAVRTWQRPPGGGPGYAPATIRVTFTIVKTALEHAVDWELLPRNPAKTVKLPPPAPRETKALSVPQARRVLTAAADPDVWYGPLYALLLTTGLRIGEVVALRWEDVDEEAGVLVIRRSLSKRLGGGYEPKGPKTASGVRRLPLIGAHRAALGRLRGRFGIAEGWLFPSSGGLPSRPENVAAAWRRFLRRNGLPAISPHKLRRTAGSLLLDMGVPVNVVAAILGHRSGATTLAFYADVMPGATRSAMDALDVLLQTPPDEI